jgi:AraC-like DNA-binding protein
MVIALPEPAKPSKGDAMSAYRVISLLTDDKQDSQHIDMHTRTHRFAFTTGEARSLEVKSAKVGRFRLNHVESTGHTIQLSDDPHTIMLPLSGGLAVAGANTDLAVGAGGLILSPPNKRRTRVYAPAKGHFQALVLQFPPSMLFGSNDRHVFPLSSRLTSVSDTRSKRFTELSALKRYLCFLDGELRAHPPTAQNEQLAIKFEALVSECLIRASAELFEHAGTSSKPDSTNARRAERALELIQARYSEPLSIGTIAAELGIGVRSLQIAFRERFNQTPREAINVTRLDAARREIQKPGQRRTASDIAIDCGFTHMGRFSAAYRKRFGEAPSKTKKT